MSRNVSIVGVDPSLTDTGVAELVCNSVGEWSAFPHNFPTVGRRGASALETADRINRISTNVAGIVQQADLLVIEGPSMGSSHGMQHERAGLWWRIVHRASMHDVPAAVVAPTTLKKFATGAGNASKQNMKNAAMTRWAHLVGPVRNDNIADALHLATIGAAGLLGPASLPPSVHPFPVDTLDAVRWPDNWEGVCERVA